MIEFTELSNTWKKSPPTADRKFKFTLPMSFIIDAKGEAISSGERLEIADEIKLSMVQDFIEFLDTVF